MKATELRIGNYVSHNEEWSYRNELRGFEFKWNESDWYALGECTLLLENCEPIPLTEEWLVNFGFITDDSRNILVYEKSNILLYKQDVWRFDLVSDSVEVKHVHSLQNLYFALTGKELEINPMLREDFDHSMIV